VVFLTNGGFIAGVARRQLVRAAEANIAALETPLLTSELHQLILVEPLLELVDLDPILLKVVPLAPQFEEVVNLGDVRRREHEALLDRPGTDRHLIAYLTPPVHHPGHHASAQVRLTHANALGPLAPLLLPLVGARVCALVVVGVGATKIAVLTIAALTIAALTRLMRTTSQTTVLWCQQGGAKGDAQRLTLFSRVVVRQKLFVHDTLAHGVPQAGVVVIPEDERSVALTNMLARLGAINFDMFPGQNRDGIVHDFPSNTRFREICVPVRLEKERPAVDPEPAIHDYRWSWRFHRGSLARADHVETRHAHGGNHALVARSTERAIATTETVSTGRGRVAIVSPFHPNYRSQSLINKIGLRLLRCALAARVQVTPHHGVADGCTPPQGSGELVVQSANSTVRGGRHELVRNTVAVVRRRSPVGTAGAAVVEVASERVWQGVASTAAW